MPVRLDHLRQLLSIVQMMQRRNGLQPTLYMPQNIAGKTANQTRIIIRFRSMASRTCAAPFVTRRRVENGRRRFIQRVVLLQFTLGKMRLYFSKRCFKPMVILPAQCGLTPRAIPVHIRIFPDRHRYRAPDLLRPAPQPSAGRCRCPRQADRAAARWAEYRAA